MKKGEFKEHIVEIEYDMAFDERTANQLLRDIRNTLQVFQRMFKKPEMTPDLWSQIEHIDYLAHGGDKFNQKRESKAE